jgi:hypothetical protein
MAQALIPSTTQKEEEEEEEIKLPAGNPFEQLLDPIKALDH